MDTQKPFFIHIIADYGPVDDLAFAEVKQAIHYHMRDTIAHIEAFSVPAFDTYATGFFLAQVAAKSHLGNQHFFYVNTAPRKDDLTPRDANAGEGLAYVELANSVRIIAVNSGYSLSFIKDFAKEMRHLDVEAAGSQFRSRDIFPGALGKIAYGDTSIIGSDIKDSIPDVPEDVVAYTDGYGNLKTTMDSSVITGGMSGKTVAVTMNGVTHNAVIADGIFGVRDGDMVLSRGSSGWTTPTGKEHKFVECVLRGGSAAEKFGFPKGGMSIKWE